MIAEILTPWRIVNNPNEEDDLKVTNQMGIYLDHSVTRCKDITYQPAVNLLPDPNLLSAYVECDESVLTDIENDSNFFVLWSE